jgi:enamine deaminase RidA (YjgF/YER057c/UK114 family)
VGGSAGCPAEFPQAMRVECAAVGGVVERKAVSSGTPWEALAGYSRAVRVGDFVWVAGTTASDNDGNLQGGDTAYAQARYIFEKIERALHEAGATLRDVVRTRVFVARLEDWQEVARAHGEVFGDIRPANTLVQVAGLIEGRLVEIEADAVIGSGTTSTR